MKPLVTESELRTAYEAVQSAECMKSVPVGKNPQFHLTKMAYHTEGHWQGPDYIDGPFVAFGAVASIELRKALNTSKAMIPGWNGDRFGEYFGAE